MPENRTGPTGASVEQHISGITDAQRRRDCEALVQLISTVTKLPPRMWGSSIVGFGSYHYASGCEGGMCITGFASRKAGISIYLLAGGARQAQLLEGLGKHKMGKACLNIRRLADIDREGLRQLIAGAVTAVKRREYQRAGSSGVLQR
jgi:Domain of unknown function (DU1801)